MNAPPLWQLPDDVMLDILSFLNLYDYGALDIAYCSHIERIHLMKVFGKVARLPKGPHPSSVIKWLAYRCPNISSLDICASRLDLSIDCDAFDGFLKLRSLTVRRGLQLPYCLSSRNISNTLTNLCIEDETGLRGFALQQIISKCNKLKSLKLSWRHDADDFYDRFGEQHTNAIISCESLVKLEIIRANPVDGSIIDLWQAAARLTHLDISLSSSECLTMPLIPSCQFSNLVVLRLHAFFGNSFVSSLICKGRMPNLQHLALLPCGAEHIDDIFSSFSDCCPNLHSLCLNSFCFFDADKMSL